MFFTWALNICGLLECEFLISSGISFQIFIPMNVNVCLTMSVLCFGVLRILLPNHVFVIICFVVGHKHFVKASRYFSFTCFKHESDTEAMLTFNNSIYTSSQTIYLALQIQVSKELCGVDI